MAKYKKHRNMGKVLWDNRILLGAKRKDISALLGWKGLSGVNRYNAVEHGWYAVPLKKFPIICQRLHIPVEELIEAWLDDIEFQLRTEFGSERRIYKIGEI